MTEFKPISDELTPLMKNYETNAKKRGFLQTCGFTQSLSFIPKICILTGSLHGMELWERIEINHTRLYIHFDDTDDANYCNLYEGENTEDVQYFSERNLIAEMKKRSYTKII